MVISINEASEVPIYQQIRNQIVLGISDGRLKPGEQLPTVRALAGEIGINSMTVNKAYAVLRQEGFVKLDRRKGAVIAIDYDKVIAEERLSENMQILLAEAMCKDITRDEVHRLVDSIYDYYQGKTKEE